MALLIEGKKQIVAEVTEVASTAFAAVVADYQGLTVEQLTALQSNLGSQQQQQQMQ